ncbi:hypothetical protein STEG23_009031 [Scotinomys teguina]
MQPDRATNNGSRTIEVVAAAPRCQLLLIVLMAAMLLPGMKVSPLLVGRKITRTIELQESIGREKNIVVLRDRPQRRKKKKEKKNVCREPEPQLRVTLKSSKE